MGLPIISIAQNADQSWTFSWSAVAGAPYYRVVLWGKQIAQINTLSYTFSGSGYPQNPPPLEIAAGSAKTLSETFQPFAQLQWYAETCSYFNVYDFDGTNWDVVQTINFGNSWVFTFDTGTLVDITNYRYGVTAVDTLGNESSREEYDLYIVCPPAPPDSGIVISYTGSGSHQVQIAAAP